MGLEFLIDTNIVIGFIDGILPRGGDDFVAGITPAISVITQIELFSSPRITTGELLQLQKFVSAAEVYRILDDDIVEATIGIRLRRKIKTPDAIIAATALAQGLTLLTRNTSDFKQIAGLNVINPFDM